MFGFKFFAKCHVFCSFSFAACNLIAATAIFTFQRSHSLKSKRINDYLALIFFVFWLVCFLLFVGLGFFGFVCKGRLFYLPVQSVGIDV